MNAVSIKQNKNALLKRFVFVSLMAVLFSSPAFAGLAIATSNFSNFLAQIQPIIRIAAVLAVIGAGVGYMFNFVDKSLLIKIIVGIIIVASATEIVGFFYTSGSVT